MERVERSMKCPRGKCGYEWESRVFEPRECPKCKKRLDWEIGDYTLPEVSSDKGDDGRLISYKKDIQGLG